MYYPAAILLVLPGQHANPTCLPCSAPADDDLLVSHQVVSLKDPMSGQRMQVGAGAEGLGAVLDGRAGG
jgi:hypothetical protein